MEKGKAIYKSGGLTLYVRVTTETNDDGKPSQQPLLFFRREVMFLGFTWVSGGRSACLQALGRTTFPSIPIVHRECTI